MIVIYVIFILLMSFILIKSADMILVGLRRLSKGTSSGAYLLSAIVLALGTSLPELSVGLASSLEGKPTISLGDTVGSNIANLSLVAGFAAFLVGKVRIRGDYLRKEIFISLLAGLSPIILILDKTLSRVDGLILLAIYASYAFSFFRKRIFQIAKEQRKESFYYRFIRRFTEMDGEDARHYGVMFVGIALLLFSADVIVRLSILLSNSFGIPSFVTGLVVVAIGTSLPELAFSLKSLSEHEPSMFFGNLLGSTIANSTLVLGVVSLIHPIEIATRNEYVIAVAAFLIIFLSFWEFIRTKHRLDRWEAFSLLALYISFVLLELNF